MLGLRAEEVERRRGRKMKYLRSRLVAGDCTYNINWGAVINDNLYNMYKK